MVVSLALNEPPPTSVLSGVPNVAEMLMDWGSGTRAECPIVGCDKRPQNAPSPCAATA